MSVDVTAIAAGEDYSCALTITGAAQRRGCNGSGALGVDTKLVATSAPITVTGLSSGVTAIAPGVYRWRSIGDTTAHTCAIVKQGMVNCWGSNDQGELGDGTTTDRWQPLAVTGLPAAALAVTTGSGFSCALLNNGVANCWGANRDGELGDGTFKSSKMPVQTVNLTNPTVLVSGSKHSCAIDQNGLVKCWGVDPSMVNWATAQRRIGAHRRRLLAFPAKHWHLSPAILTPVRCLKMVRSTVGDQTITGNLATPCKIGAV